MGPSSGERAVDPTTARQPGARYRSRPRPAGRFRLAGRSRPASRSRPARRSQSEVVGVLLLTGVIVLLVGVVGLFVLSGVDTSPDPTTDVEVEVGHDTVNLSHAGGDALAVSEVVVIYGRDVYRSVDLADTEELAVDDDDRFEGGERRQASHSATGILSVTVVHEPSNTVIAREVLDVPTP